MNPRRFAASHHMPYDGLPRPALTPKQEEDRRMLTGYEGPGERVAHCALSAHSLALKIARNVDMPVELRDEVTKVALLISEIPADVAALSEYATRLAEDNQSLCDSGLRMAREITELRRERDDLAATQTAPRYAERDTTPAPTNDDATAA
jgi:hypothetical protein